jgi:ABC-type sulfate transport system substrate-binding protein
MKKIDHLSAKAILIGNPSQLNNIEKTYKDKVIEIIIPEADILFSFGYGTSL